ncbi:hypothetical protein C3L33_01178, partial [Rhododendron williamsianum]
MHVNPFSSIRDESALPTDTRRSYCFSNNFHFPSVKPVKSAECNRHAEPRQGNRTGFRTRSDSPGAAGSASTAPEPAKSKSAVPSPEHHLSSILINLPAECGRTVQQTEQLFGPNYALTSQNGLLLKNCTSQLNDCIIPTAMVKARFGSLDCGFGSDNVSCYAGTDAGSRFISYDNLTRSGCREVYSSIAEVDVGGDDDDAGRNSTVSLQFQAAELGWWLGGRCNCSVEADCTNMTVPGGGPSASKYMSGECGGRTRVGVLIAGIIAGALLMAAVFATCYFIKRRSRSVRNLTSTKRLLCDAAGNSSVPFYQYKEIERATNSFSEKQRLGTGAYGTVYAGKLHNNDFGVVLVEIITAFKVVDFSRPHSEVNLAALAIDRIGKGRLDEIIDPFLEPNRDAWTLSSLHKVAELAFRCLAFHRDMRPSMMEVADELEQIRLSGWAPIDENTCMASLSVASSCSSPYNGSEKFGGTSSRSQRLRARDCSFRKGR